MRFILLLCPLWLFFTAPLQASDTFNSTFSAQVTFDQTSPSVKLVADGAVRVDAMLLQALQSQQPAMSTLSIDWSNSRLFSRHPPFTLKANLLKTLAQLQNKVPDPQSSAWQKLRDELRKRTFAERQFIPLDPDITRVVAGNNPLLRGDFALYLPRLGHHNTITVLGAVYHSEQQEWQASFSARDYAQKAQWINTTLGELTVIQPNGEVQKHPIGYWNSKPLTILPGAIVYVPFTGHLFSSIDHAELEQINQQVVELLRHQLPRE